LAIEFIIDQEGAPPPKRKRGRPPKPKAPPQPAEESRGERAIGWIARACFVPEGARVGQKMELLTWQKEFLLAIYDNRTPTRRAILSVGRKNGKSSLTAAILLLHLCGPEGQANRNSQIYSAAQSRDQAALVFSLAAKMVRLHPVLRSSVLIHESKKALSFPEFGTFYRALAAEATTAYGLSPALVIHDELGQICPRKQIKPLQNMGFQTAT
jgi:phage terminase large subunit-like protein